MLSRLQTPARMPPPTQHLGQIRDRFLTLDQTQQFRLTQLRMPLKEAGFALSTSTVPLPANAAA